MTYEELLSVLGEYAPLSLSEEMCRKDDLYDNSGGILPTDREVKTVLFTLDLTAASAAEAERLGCDVVVTHHPAVYHPIRRLKEGEPLLTLARKRIGVVSMHLNFDAARRGIDHYFAEGLGARNARIASPLGEETGYGRLFDLSPVTAKELKSRYESVFRTKKVWLYGDEGTIIRKAASFCGAGLDGEAVGSAVSFGAQLVASADVFHHVLLSALESGLCVLSCTHYATENYGMKKIAEYFRDTRSDLKICFFEDERYL